MYNHWIVVQWQEAIFFSKASRWGLGTTQPLSHSTLEASFIGVKWPWHEADHWPPCNAGNKNVWSCFSHPHVSCSCTQEQLYLIILLLSCISNLYANWQGTVGEPTVIMTELTSCELCLYHSAGAVSCDCVAVCNLLLAVSEIWKLWIWRAWKFMLNCTWWIHVSVTTTGMLKSPSL